MIAGYVWRCDCCDRLSEPLFRSGRPERWVRVDLELPRSGRLLASDLCELCLRLPLGDVVAAVERVHLARGQR